MKEATGELNMTVITIVAIAAIVAFFYFFIYPGIRDSIILNQMCNDPWAYQDEDEDGNSCDALGDPQTGNGATCTVGKTSRKKLCTRAVGTAGGG